MSFLRPTNGFDRVSDSKLTERAQFVLIRMSDNPSFPTPSPSLNTISLCISEFVAAVQAAGSGDRMQIAIKNEKRESLINNLYLLIYYVLFTSAGNRTVAESAGFYFAKEPAPAPVILKPANLTVENTNQVGQLAVSVKRVKGALAYMHQYTTDPLLKEESWQTATTSVSKCILSGLKPGTTYYCRVGAIGRKDQLLFSDVVSRVAA